MIYAAAVKQMMSTIIITVVLCLIVILVGLKVKKLNPKGETPKWLIPFIMLVEWVNNSCKENFGRRWKSYAPYFLTLVMFLFFANISGVFGLTSPTSYLIINAVWAIITFFIIQITGIVSLGPKKYLKGFIDPWYLSPLLLPINIISEFTLPISLALRLMGNIMSGGVLSILVTGLGSQALNGWWLVLVLPIFNLIFDLFSGVIQVLIFMQLSMTFAGMKVDEKEFIEENKEVAEATV